MTRSLLAAIALLAAACHADMTGPVIAGTYDLSRVNGRSVPAPFPQGIEDEPATVTRGVVILEANARWRADITMTVATDGAPLALTEVFSGTYTVSRDTIYFRDSDNGPVESAVLRGTRLTAMLEAVTFDFDRR